MAGASGLSRPRLLFVVTEDWYFCSHRLPLAIAAQERGYDVAVATRVDQHGETIRRAGLRLLPLRHLRRRSVNPWRELAALLELYRLFRKEAPDLVHLVALKPVIYGGIAARIAGVPHTVAAIAGMGHLFTAEDLQTRFLAGIALYLYRLALSRPGVRLILQNAEDERILIEAGIVSAEQCHRIRGSGVDLARFTPQPETESPVTVILASRLLWTKGVREFVEAARILKSRGVMARFLVAGAPDPENPAAIPESELAAWCREGIVELLGHRTDIETLFARGHVIVLPSYREGLPKVLVEAAACGRAVVTTDRPGCRDAIEPGVSGLLVPVRDARALADAIGQLLGNPALRQAMGRAGRALAEREFAVEKVVEQHLAVYGALLNEGGRN